jgi:hypothetical protein
MPKLGRTSRLTFFGTLSLFIATTFAARQTPQPPTQKPTQAPTSPHSAANTGLARSDFHWTLTYAAKRSKRSKQYGTIKSYGLKIGPLNAMASKQASK